MTKSLRAVTLALCLVWGLSSVRAADLYVSPTGTPEGDGSRARPLDVFTALSAKSPARPGDTIILLAGRYDGHMEGIKRVPFALAVSGAKGRPITVRPEAGKTAHLNGTVSLTSSFTHYIGLDIGDLEWDPWMKKHKNDTAMNAMGGTDAKVINCNIFGGAMGTGGWSVAHNLELYGCLIHDFGYLEAAGRGHGHAYYAQNETGTKIFQHNIAWRGCGWNVHIYTQEGRIIGFDVLENICYIAGAYKPGQTMDNFLVYSKTPADRIRLIGNVAYEPTDVAKWRPNMRLSNVYRVVTNGTAEVRDNYVMGSYWGLSIALWKKITVTGNTIWSTGAFMEISSVGTGSALRTDQGPPDLKPYTVDNNAYIDNGRTKVFYYGDKENKTDAEMLTFPQWKALGLDKHSRLIEGRDGRPTGTRVFVFPNKYEKGRANVGVFNWDALRSVDVDLSKVLRKGQPFAVYNCLDITQTLAQAKPVLEGTYTGTPINFPTRRDKISPDFDAFLVVPRAR